MIAKRLALLLPVIVAALALGKSSDTWQLAAIVAGIATLLASIGPRWELDRGRQLVTCAIGAGVGYAIVPVFYDPHPGFLGEGWTRFAAAILLAAAARFPVLHPEGGRMATTTLVFGGLLAVGETHFAGYTAYVALFLLTTVLTPGDDDPSRWTETTARRLAIGTAMSIAGGAIAGGATVGLHRASSWLTRGERSTALIWSPRVGFSDRMDLGALDGLLDSDTVVLRVRGPRVDYLRGAALDFYAAGQWLRSDGVDIETKSTYSGDLSPPDGIEVAAVSERTERFFLPLDARLIVASPADVLVDAVGAVKRAGKGGLNVAHFVVGPRDRAAPAPPGASDLQLPHEARARLASLATEWTDATATTAEKLDAIERKLRADFRYARTVPRFGGGDPVLDFLLVGKRGHCEYFATAMTLVARAARIPSRIVMGYRVGEESPFGYYVVRERNAHAWVEAWIPGRGWVTRDPTPDTDLPQNREHRAGYAASIADALRVGYYDLTERLRRLTLRQTAIAWAFGFIVLIWIVARGARRRATQIGVVSDDESALPCLGILLSTLESAGHARQGQEPIERFAARVPDPRASELLQRYAALRYGSVGDAGALAEDITAYKQRQRERRGPLTP